MKQEKGFPEDPFRQKELPLVLVDCGNGFSTGLSSCASQVGMLFTVSCARVWEWEQPLATQVMALASTAGTASGMWGRCGGRWMGPTGLAI